jgi:2-alkyl-3-oxoalkanoate reductase
MGHPPHRRAPDSRAGTVKVVVTGATGFLGSHTVATLQARGVDVLALGRDAGKVAQFGTRGLRLDLTDLEGLSWAFQGADAVVHTAALSAPWGRLEDFQRVNVDGTRNVLRAASSAGVKRLVHISSPAVIFDDADQFDVPDDAPYPSRHSSFYALTKKRAEQLVLESELECAVLRPKAIYGPGDTSLLPRLVTAARAGRLPQIGDGGNLVELTFVTDVVQAIERSLEVRLGADRTPYTITGGERVPLWNAIRALLEGLGVSSRLPVLSMRAALTLARGLEVVAAFTGREPRLTRYTAQILARTQTYDTSRAGRDLGYQPRVSLGEGLERTLEALRRSA